MEEEGGGEFRGPWWRGPKSTLSLVSPHIRTLKIAYTYVLQNYMGLVSHPDFHATTLKLINHDKMWFDKNF